MSGVGIDGEVLSYLELAQVRSNLPFTFSVYSTSSFNADKTFHCCIWTNKDVTNESQKPPAVCNRKDLKVLSFRHCSPCWASFEKNNKGPAPTPAPLCPAPPEAAASHVGEQFRAWEGKALALFWILRRALAEIRQFLEFRLVPGCLWSHCSSPGFPFFFFTSAFVTVDIVIPYPNTHCPLPLERVRDQSWLCLHVIYLRHKVKGCLHFLICWKWGW